jgi:hypothetical protein
MTNLIAVYIPEEVVMREASNSPDCVNEDINVIHEACVKAWNEFSEKNFRK